MVPWFISHLLFGERWGTQMFKAVKPGITGPVLLATLAGFALAGCGEKFSGTYLAQGRATYKKVEFKSDRAVEVIYWQDQILPGTYKMDGEKMVITGAAPEPLYFTVDDKGCLNLVNRRGASFEGKFCKKSD